MATTTFDENLFSDLYKEVNGVRPLSSNVFYSASKSEKQKIWDRLLVDLEEAQQNYEREQKERVASSTLERPEAIRKFVLEQGVEFDGDAGYICYLLDIPYEYQGEIASAFA